MTLEILKRNTDGLINFRGFMVGNPFVDPHTNTLTQFRAYYYHGLVAKPLYDEYNKRCSDPSNFSPVVRADDGMSRTNGTNTLPETRSHNTRYFSIDVP